MKMLVIETITKKGSEFGISFNGPNPEEKDYIPMLNSKSAFKLIERIEGNKN